MSSISFNILNTWLETYSKASIENDVKTSANLFSQNARYYETPFSDPIIGREAIRQYWEGGAQAFKNKEAMHEILAIKDNLGIARWRTWFTNIRSNTPYELDCLFIIEFDGNEKCSEFREWWHIRELDTASSQETDL